MTHQKSLSICYSNVKPIRVLIQLCCLRGQTTEQN